MLHWKNGIFELRENMHTLQQIFQEGDTSHVVLTTSAIY